jgi:excisionase family DNA binding protein
MATQSLPCAADCASPLLTDYVDKATLARELGKTPRTVDRLVLCDGLPCVQIGNKRLFRRDAVLEWLRSRETPKRPQNKGGRRSA